MEFWVFVVAYLVGIPIAAGAWSVADDEGSSAIWLGVTWPIVVPVFFGLGLLLWSAGKLHEVGASIGRWIGDFLDRSFQ